MARVADSFEQIFLTYKDVRDANPQWSNQMIEDYLSLKRDVNSVAEETDSVQDQIDTINIELAAIGIRLDIIDGKLIVIDARLDGIDLSIADILLRLDALEALTPISVYTIISYAVLVNEVVTCGNAVSINITLPASPLDGQAVTVKRTDAEVIILGNGKLIDGDSSVTLYRQYVGLDLVYSLDGGFWSIV